MYNITYNITHNCYQTSDVISEVWYHTSDMICLISDNKHHWHQTSDNSYMTADLWCQTSDIRHLSNNCKHTSDVWCYKLCYITFIRRLSLDVWHHITVISCLMSFVWYQTSYVISEIRRLITVVWCWMSKGRCNITQHITSDIRRLDNSYMISDF